MLNCQGPYDYNRYMGEGVFTGEVTGFENDETCYGFIIPTEKEICFFVKEEIVAEFDQGGRNSPALLTKKKLLQNFTKYDNNN